MGNSRRMRFQWLADKIRQRELEVLEPWISIRLLEAKVQRTITKLVQTTSGQQPMLG